MNNVLHVENVTMQFGGVVAVNNLSLDIPEGKIVALIGPNGAGKTTAFNCITGVYQPTSGLVEFMGKPMVRSSPSGKMKKQYKGENAELYANQSAIDPTPDCITKLGIARTFQNIRLWKSMTVFENVLIAKHMRAKQNVFSAIFRVNAKEEKRSARRQWRSCVSRVLTNTRTSLQPVFLTVSSAASKLPARWLLTPSCCSSTSLRPE